MTKSKALAWALLLAVSACGRTNSIEALSINPSAITLAPGGRQDLVATATFSDGTQQDVTASLDWSSTDEQVATITHDPSGKVTVVAAGGGTAGIVAKAGETRGLATVTVSTSSLQSL